MGRIVAAYSDGGIMGHNPSSEGGSWAWCHTDSDDAIVASDAGIIKPTKKWPQLTNNYTEFVAALRCLEALPARWSGRFYCDSQVTVGRLFWEWACSNIPDILYRRALAATKRLGNINPVLLAGHPTKADLQSGVKNGVPVSAFNVWCDSECRRVMQEHWNAKMAELSRRADMEAEARVVIGQPTVPQHDTGASTMPQEARKIPDEWFTT